MSFFAPEAQSLPRFHAKQAKSPNDTSEVPEYRSISPPRSRSSSNASKSSFKQSKMSSLLNKIKPKRGDSSEKTSSDGPDGPLNGTQNQNTIDEQVGKTTASDSGDGVRGQLDAQQAMKDVEQDMGKESSAMK